MFSEVEGLTGASGSCYNMDMKTFTEAFDSFLLACQTLHSNHYKDGSLQYVLRATEGKRYIKIVTEQVGTAFKGTTAWAFIDKNNGDVLKAASWSAPAKHARGNIFDSSNGMSKVGVYGPNYL